MKVVHIFSSGDAIVTVSQHPSGKLRIVYGEEVHDGLDYGRAAEVFGVCVFHSLACAGKLSNED